MEVEQRKIDSGCNTMQLLGRTKIARCSKIMKKVFFSFGEFPLFSRLIDLAITSRTHF